MASGERSTPIPAAERAPAPETGQEARIARLETQVAQLSEQVAELTKLVTDIKSGGAARPPESQPAAVEARFENIEQFGNQVCARLRAIAKGPPEIRPLRGFALDIAVSELESRISQIRTIDELMSAITDKILDPIAAVLMRDYEMRIVRIGVGEFPSRRGFEAVIKALAELIQALNKSGATGEEIYFLPGLDDAFVEDKHELHHGGDTVPMVRTDSARGTRCVFLPVVVGKKNRSDERVTQKARVLKY